MAVKHVVVTLALITAACSTHTDCNPEHTADARANEERLRTMRAQQEEHRRLLDQLSQEIATSEARAREAKLEAEFLECRALQAQIDSAVSFQQATCASDAAKFQLCRADNAKRAGKRTLLGCLGGIAFAALTSGAGTPVALGGCGLGYVSGEARAVQCRIPSCTSDSKAVEAAVLAQRKLAERPRCGGEAGFGISTLLRRDTGVTVKRVGPGSTALAAGLAPNDVITALNGTPIASRADLETALAASKLAAVTGGMGDVEITFVRNHTLYRGNAPLVKRDARGQRSARPQLGLKCGQSVTVEYAAGTQVATIRDSGAAAKAGLQPGDSIVSVSVVGTDDAQPKCAGPQCSPAILQQLLDGVRAGGAVAITLERDGQPRDINLVLESRHET